MSRISYSKLSEKASYSKRSLTISKLYIEFTAMSDLIILQHPFLHHDSEGHVVYIKTMDGDKHIFKNVTLRYF